MQIFKRNFIPKSSQKTHLTPSHLNSNIRSTQNFYFIERFSQTALSLMYLWIIHKSFSALVFLLHNIINIAWSGKRNHDERLYSLLFLKLFMCIHTIFCELKKYYMRENAILGLYSLHVLPDVLIMLNELGKMKKKVRWLHIRKQCRIKREDLGSIPFQIISLWEFRKCLSDSFLIKLIFSNKFRGGANYKLNKKFKVEPI